MARLTIRGSKKYTRYMEKHLHEEHPRTKGRTKVARNSKRKGSRR